MAQMSAGGDSQAVKELHVGAAPGSGPDCDPNPDTALGPDVVVHKLVLIVATFPFESLPGESSMPLVAPPVHCRACLGVSLMDCGTDAVRELGVSHCDPCHSQVTLVSQDTQHVS